MDKEMIEAQLSAGAISIKELKEMQKSAVEFKSNASLSDGDIDWVYDCFDELLLSHQYELCDRIIQKSDAGRCSVDLLLAIATITLPAKSKLPSRHKFLENIILTHRDLILDGLW